MSGFAESRIFNYSGYSYTVQANALNISIHFLICRGSYYALNLAHNSTKPFKLLSYCSPHKFSQIKKGIAIFVFPETDISIAKVCTCGGFYRDPKEILLEFIYLFLMCFVL